MLSIIAVILFSYLLGSIPTAIIASRLVMKGDIRNHGSKNAGATNVFRVMGWKPALVVVLIDVLKGTAATLLVSKLAMGPGAPLEPVVVQTLAGAAAIVGHVWTVFAGFKGGKGVGTAFGVLLGLAPVPVFIALAVWLALVFTTRIVSIGSLAAAVVFPAALIVQKAFFKPAVPVSLVVFSLCFAALILITHPSNIRRLLRGEENRFGAGHPAKRKP
jgi:glycerol-3-phosphate acyltransferase PlsY